MLFTEGRFFLFFFLVLGVHWALRSFRARKLWLLLCSYAFYAGWDWRFLSLIIFSTCVDFYVGRRIHAAEEGRSRRLWLILSMSANLGLLGFFKYYNFFADSAADLLRWFGFSPNETTLLIVLPVGISFYTFQTMSYTIDIYRRHLKPVSSFSDFALFVGFFPQLVAGPIVRAIEFLPQLEEKRTFARHVQVRAALTLFLVGFVKKACVADHAAEIIDVVFTDPASWSTSSNWLSLLMYHIQLYCDFSGYSDMAIGSAGLLGFKLPLNFDFPYFARNIAELWRRWHITLSSWIKDYLFVPLGGSRSKAGRLIFNVCLTWALCGLWHGAGWNYVVWGLINATYLLIFRVWSPSAAAKSLPGRLIHFAGIPLTNLFWLWSLVCFRGQSFGSMMDMLRITVGLQVGGAEQVDPNWWAYVVGCGIVHWCFWKLHVTERLAALGTRSFALAYGILWALVLPWVATGYTPFIYFQF